MEVGFKGSEVVGRGVLVDKGGGCQPAEVEWVSAGLYMHLSFQSTFTSTACLPLSTSQSSRHFHQRSLPAFICTLAA